MTQEDQELGEAQDPQVEHPLVGLKVVLNILEEVVMVGISRGEVDPHMESCAISPDDDIQEVLAVVPQVLEHAWERWQTQPSFPPYQPPPGAPAAPRAARAAPQNARGRPAAGAPDAQRPRMF